MKKTLVDRFVDAATVALWILLPGLVALFFVAVVQEHDECRKTNEWRKTVDARLEALEKTTPQPGE